MVVMQISETTDLEALDGKKAIDDAMIRVATELISSIKSGMCDSIEGGDLILHGRIVRAQLRANAVLLRQQVPARI